MTPWAWSRRAQAKDPPAVALVGDLDEQAHSGPVYETNTGRDYILLLT